MRHYFFVCSAQYQIAIMAVFHSHEFLAYHLPSTGSFPELRGLKNGQKDLLCASTIHFLADNRSNLE